DPVTFRTSQHLAEAAAWRAGAISEFKSLWDHDVYGLVLLCAMPRGRRLLKSRWVFKSKRGTDSEVLRHKAHVVVKGFAQAPGVDFDVDQLSAPVAGIDNIRLVLALVCFSNWVLRQLEVDTAYLRALLKTGELHFMEQPEGFEMPGPSGERLVWRLKRSL
ncbi:unnamed protein product, partial [Phaeothamnion confervicola]